MFCEILHFDTRCNLPLHFTFIIAETNPERDILHQKVDIFLGNHTENNQTLERRQRLIENPDGPNPFIDPKQWAAYLDQKREALLELIANEKNQA